MFPTRTFSDQLFDYQLIRKDSSRSKLLGDQNMAFCEFRQRKTMTNEGQGSGLGQLQGNIPGICLRKSKRNAHHPTFCLYVKTTAYWVVTPCSFVFGQQYSGGQDCPHLHTSTCRSVCRARKCLWHEQTALRARLEDTSLSPNKAMRLQAVTGRSKATPAGGSSVTIVLQ